MTAPWLLLIHQIPPAPAYLRVKVRRRLQRLGAGALKNSVYVLPNTPEALEDFQWLAGEIRAGGGEAVIAEATLVEGLRDAEVSALIEGEARPRHRPAPPAPGRTWVTRKGVFIDRIASAWLIRRWIDPKARFKFTAARTYTPRPGEVRFDMFQAEYTHEGDRCTFEVLLERFRLAQDPALRTIGQVVHDIDCKDDKFRRPEVAGVTALLQSIAARESNDRRRLERGRVLFDDLYAALAATGRATGRRRAPRAG